MINTPTRMKRLFNIVILIAVMIVCILITTSCVCPLFSMLERFTGLQISTGKNIDTSSVSDELIYPGSIALVQINGDIERILDLIGEYGAALSDDGLKVLEELPENIKEQEIGAIVYSTSDDEVDVLDYYISLKNRNWKIDDFGDAGGSLNWNSIIVAEKMDRKQALMIGGTETSSFIIFIDFNWDILENSEK